MSRKRIILADDHRIFAEGLTALLEERYEVVDVVEDGRSLLTSVREHRPDLVVTDLSMPEMNGLDALQHLRSEHPDLRIVLLTMHEDVGLATAAVRAGVSGYVLKNAGAQELLQALEQALDGGVHISSRLAKAVMSNLSAPASERAFTERQEQVVRLLMAGLSTKEIAARIHLSPRTVEFHKYQAIERAGVGTTAELIAHAARLGLRPL